MQEYFLTDVDFVLGGNYFLPGDLSWSSIHLSLTSNYSVWFKWIVFKICATSPVHHRHRPLLMNNSTPPLSPTADSMALVSFKNQWYVTSPRKVLGIYHWREAVFSVPLPFKIAWWKVLAEASETSQKTVSEKSQRISSLNMAMEMRSHLKACLEFKDRLTRK